MALGYSRRPRYPAWVSWLVPEATKRLALLLVTLGVAGCSRDDAREESTYYSRRIEPLLQSSCAASPTGSGCHVLADFAGNALGNLSVESYDDVFLRRDLLVNYGPYGIPGLLLKVVPDFKISLTAWNRAVPSIVTTDIAHGGERLIDYTSPGFTALENWIRDGASKNNAPQSVRVFAQSECAEAVGSDAGFDSAVLPSASDYPLFRERVGRLLGESCAAGNCHGSVSNSLYLTCGKTEEQLRWNYFAASDYVSISPAASEILRRTLSPAAGGTYHEGGPIFRSTADPGYQDMLAWATERGGPALVPTDPGFEFFASRVQPMLVKRGCMMLGCHSAAMFHDYRLRGGSGGHFGLPATRKNYELSLEQLALESPDPNTSRLIKKNLPLQAGGVLHRGGPLFAGFRGPEDCDLAAAETGPLDEQAPYCVMAVWISRERAVRMANQIPLSGIVYVRRSPKPGRNAPQDWADFAAGSELVQVLATQGVDGDIALGAESSLSARCGLDRSSSEVRRPAVSWDGQRIAFAARVAESEPFRIYVTDSSSCALDAAIDAAPVDETGTPLPTNGELVHNFDPAFAPDGRIVFVSTRGNVMNTSAFSYRGPQRSAADPSKANTNIYVREADGSIRQLTFLLNQELLPAFMRDGRVILSAEKRAPEFYQLAGRRINLDGGDYHPLYGQRSSIGFTQLTDVVELSDKNFAGILSERGARHGAGALALVNRSLGVDQASADPSDYLVDPAAISFPVPGFYQNSLKILNPEASGKLSGTRGAYAAPSPLPDGRILVSYAAAVTDLANFNGGFDVVIVDPRSTGPSNVRPLITGADDALWPAAVYARQNLGVFRSKLDEPNGATRIVPGQAHTEITFLDLPLMTTLLFQNTRLRTPLPPGRVSVEFWESLPPEPGVRSFADGGAFVTQDQYGPVYVRRARLGSVQPFVDGSAKVRLRGGVPFMLATETTLASDDGGPRLHFQREEMQFYPGEQTRQSFRREFFNGICGGCHGGLSGKENHVVIDPDILTQASQVHARDEPATPLLGPAPNPPEGPSAP